MAKNRKQDRSRQKASVAANGPQETEHSVTQSQPATGVQPDGSAGRKGRQKRFGHN
ncbi:MULTISPECIES: hypothetical protein [Streptomyces]|uniref:Uncharacterized protein n=1 Tax=Streptomyces thermoviolaceus subsp. thermoviolaceus TaxID=66860 RepID=A0ABX0YRF3_STRTL|nr:MULTISPECIES: hypothetical protein [Streptomyces]MCM3265296.1 hypothetical protein [Streptomyces thermoviolaceus]NJP14519.1 hypothetical protein [Streptomyces thermoviolaceus subsp. thermoviolaceus]WTD49613.1 hypothetical protein OG899_20100 [Streptomyces thermoviolaceus]GGV62102.1 hypothetical protein GCM10010499_04270 [Streptomyces thermoviolaceus subsp. apingens]GHA78935.1 hypothetical protein GCM10010512_07340 [Streptomyces thermoviolaceus subsp. thermoviolaceus]